MERRAFIALLSGGALLAVPLAASAQARTKARRLDFLTPRSRPSSPDRDAFSEAFIQGMRELGYVEGRIWSSSGATPMGTTRACLTWRPNSLGWISRSS